MNNLFLKRKKNINVFPDKNVLTLIQNYSKNKKLYDFYLKYSNKLNELYQPLYKNRGLIVAFDYKEPHIGKYIIVFSSESKANFIRANAIIKILKQSVGESEYIIHSYQNDLILVVELNNKNIKVNKKHRKIILKNNNAFKYLINKLDLKKEDNLLYNKFEDREKKINLSISNNCFVKCRGCYNNFCQNPTLEYGDVISFLRYAKSRGLEKVTLSGGDPLAHKDIFKIINFCHKLKLSINLDSVGIPFVKDANVLGKDYTVKKINNLNLLNKISSVGVPLDGSNNNIISRFRKGRTDLFGEMICILKTLEKQNVNVCINTVVHKQNINDVYNIYEIIKDFKCVKKWQLFQFMPIGPLGYKNKESFQIEYADFMNLEKQFFDNNISNFEIEFKPAKERAYNYMLINANGDAYKVDLNNNIENFGTIKNSDDWNNILDNLF